jgi:hypothetical protein
MLCVMCNCHSARDLRVLVNYLLVIYNSLDESSSSCTTITLFVIFNPTLQAC